MIYSILCENKFDSWKVDLEWLKEAAQKILDYYLNDSEIKETCCLGNYKYNKIAFDFLFCDSELTHDININYRNKDYPADIITFAVFADSIEEERFVLDGEINLGEIIIALDKMVDGAALKGISKEDELLFFISHGIMHLLGFDHQTEVDYNFVVGKQKKALESMNINYDKI